MQLLFTKFILLTIAPLLLLGACCDQESEAPVTKAVAPLTASKYDGKIVHQPAASRPGIDDGLFLVRGGKRLWIADGKWLAQNGHNEVDILTIDSAEFNKIPLDPLILQ